jgi:hypothetical protein
MNYESALAFVSKNWWWMLLLAAAYLYLNGELGGCGNA